MDLLPTALRVFEGEDPATAFRNAVESLSTQLKLRCALYVDSAEPPTTLRWPETAEVTADLLDMGMHVIRPEIFPIGSEFPLDAVTYPDSEALLLPLRLDQKRTGMCLLVAESGSFGEDLQPWQAVIQALEKVNQRYQRLRHAEQECRDLQRRVEESEALHTLGLAANRSLDMEEVLKLVTRFTRTLLGAHYVTVSTVDGGMIYNVASVGLRNGEAALDDYQLAGAVVAAQKPLVVGGANGDLSVDDFPFHAAEGMKSGLGIPLSLFGDTFGALLVGYRRDYAITPQDTRLAITLAGHAAVAISNARLHETVEERSRELQTAYSELDSITQAKERFFASINHELRNPLGAILNYIELTLDGSQGELPPSADKFLRKARRAGETLRALVNDILDLSKLAAGKMEIEHTPCSVSEIFDSVQNTTQPFADERGLQLELRVPSNLPLLNTDPLRVQQILVNLVSNAVKFSRDGSVVMEANATSEQGESSIEIRVIDTGAGISAEDLTRIFEEYEQVKGTRGGTGLGLPISRRLARALGGELWATSEIGVGSTFVLQLPAIAGTEPSIE